MLFDKLENVSCAPFASIGQALSFYNNNNPARARYRNFYEPEHGQKPAFEDFSGRSPSDIWASITLGITEVMAGLDHDRKWAFLWRNIGDRTRQLSVEEIASRLGRSKSTVYRYLKELDNDLKDEFTRRNLIERADDGAAGAD